MVLCMTFIATHSKCRYKVEIEQPERRSKRAQLARLHVHHLYIYLGDLERYQRDFKAKAPALNATSDGDGDGNTSDSRQLHLPGNAGDTAPPLQAHVGWDHAKSNYTVAMQLYPKNGKPYNQLAVLALQAENTTEALYYYARSLSVRSPILTARDALANVFEKVRLKYQNQNQPANANGRGGGGGGRGEGGTTASRSGSSSKTKGHQKEKGKSRSRSKGKRAKDGTPQQQQQTKLGSKGGQTSAHNPAAASAAAAAGLFQWDFGFVRKQQVANGGGGAAVEAAEDGTTSGKKGSNPAVGRTNVPSAAVLLPLPPRKVRELKRDWNLQFLAMHGLLFSRVGLEDVQPRMATLMQLYSDMLDAKLFTAMQLVRVTLLGYGTIPPAFILTQDSTRTPHVYTDGAFQNGCLCYTTISVSRGSVANYLIYHLC